MYCKIRREFWKLFAELNRAQKEFLRERDWNPSSAFPSERSSPRGVVPSGLGGAAGREHRPAGCGGARVLFSPVSARVTFLPDLPEFQDSAYNCVFSSRDWLLSGLFLDGLQTSSKRFVSGRVLADLSWYRK